MTRLRYLLKLRRLILQRKSIIFWKIVPNLIAYFSAHSPPTGMVHYLRKVMMMMARQIIKRLWWWIMFIYLFRCMDGLCNKRWDGGRGGRTIFLLLKQMNYFGPKCFKLRGCFIFCLKFLKPCIVFSQT